MVKRVAVGAASAAAVVFAVILLSDVVLFASSEQRAILYAQADASGRLADEAAVLSGAAATNVLIGAQRLLAAGPVDCSTAAEVTGRMEGLGDTQRSGALAVSVSSRVIPGTDLLDNLTTVFPFNGSTPGALTLSLQVTARSGSPLAGASYGRTLTHVVHLPVLWDSALSDCLGAVASFSGTVPDSRVANCTPGVVGPLMQAIASQPEASAEADGFHFGYTYAIEGQSPCAVSFRVTVEQTEVDGPEGPFNVLLAGEGSASFA